MRPVVNRIYPGRCVRSNRWCLACLKTIPSRHKAHPVDDFPGHHVCVECHRTDRLAVESAKNTAPAPGTGVFPCRCGQGFHGQCGDCGQEELLRENREMYTNHFNR